MPRGRGAEVSGAGRVFPRARCDGAGGFAAAVVRVARAPRPRKESRDDMLETRNGIRGKVCSTCKQWKALADFPTDPTHPPTQGGRHCRCKECHRKTAAKKTAAARKIGSVISILAVLLLLSVIATAKVKPTYQTGKLIDLSVLDVTMGVGVVGGMAAPIRASCTCSKSNSKTLFISRSTKQANSATSRSGP